MNGEKQRNLEEKMALSTTVKKEACDNLQGKRYPIIIIKIKIIRLTSNAGGMRRDRDSKIITSAILVLHDCW